MQSEARSNIKNKLIKILAYFFSFLFILMGLVLVFGGGTSALAAGILIILSGLFFLPPLVSRLPKDKFPRKWRIITITVLFIVGFSMIPSTNTDPAQSEPTPEAPTTNNTQIVEEKQEDEPKEKTDSQASPVEYEIVKSEDQSMKAMGGKSLSDYTAQEISELPTNKRLTYKIVVSPEIKEEQVKPTIRKIISDITSKDGDIDEISLLLYSDAEIVSGAYDVAMATWAPTGESGNVTPEIAKNNDRTNYETTVQIKENLEEYLQKREESDERFGFTEEERREFFKELYAAEKKARTEADKLYPIDASDPNYKQGNVEKNLNKNDELMKRYKQEVRDEYGITKDVESNIVAEAFEEGWPQE